MTYGVYRVIGKRLYRGHEPGTEFVARIPRLAERRAIARGDIELVEYVTPDLREGSYALPSNWIGGESERTAT
jgi:hypothetical protein